MIYLLLGMAAAAGVYQLLALAAAVRHLRANEAPSGWHPPVSILKPVRGLDPRCLESFRSHAVQDYPQFEILFGVSDPDDPAIAEVQRLATEFPRVPIRLIVSTASAPNGKVGVLEDLAAAARHSILVVNDSDIRVPEDYLRRIVAPLESPNTGVVTCLYRGRGDTWPARFEAVGIATDFVPGVLVAPLVGVSEFGLGSTLVVRAADVRRIGGFAALSSYIADDYQLSRHIRNLGRRVVLSKLVVETNLADEGWVSMWRHQLRWARTIRVSRGDGYMGLPVTHAGLWALLLALAGHGWAALALAAVRLAAGLTVSAGVLRDARAASDAFLIPFRDLFAFAVWAAGLFGSTVVWRGSRLRLDKEGKIVEFLPSRAAAAEPKTLKTSG